MAQLRTLLRAAGLASLTMFGLALVAAPARAVTDVCYRGGPTLANFKLNGAATLDGSSIVITEAVGNLSGSVMYQTPLSAVSDFHIKTKVRITTPPGITPADGMTFVMHSAAGGAGTTGGIGGGIGYAGITPSVVVEFDTYFNTWDPTSPHIAITRAGDPSHVTLNNIGLPAPVRFSTLTPPVDPVNGTPFFIWIDYTAVGTKLDVFVSATDAKPATAALTTTAIDLNSELGGTFFIGFTSSTGGAWSKHEFLELYASDNGATANAGCCSANADCVGSPTGEICDPSKNICGACTISNVATCPSGNAGCDLATAHNACVTPCDGNFGDATAAPCASAAYPACRLSGAAAGSCGACAGDFGSGSIAACAAGAPFCAASGYCGLCTSNTDCNDAGATHTGGFCNGDGRCVSSCVVDGDCGPGNACLNLTCVAKGTNGSPIPGGVCSPGLGAQYCVSGVCSADNDTCGYVDGTGTCDAPTAATVCQSGTCSGGNVCIPASSGACYIDGDCLAGSYCDRGALLCKVKIPAGGAIPNDGLHDGTCSGATGMLVCASGLCNSATHTCAAANGATCTGAADCHANICGSNDKCGADIGQGGCTAGTAAVVCQSGACSSNGVCIPATTGGCFVDGDCPTTQFCKRDTFSCTTKLGPGVALPNDGLHNGTCTDTNAALICAAGLCNAVTNSCAGAVGATCAAASACANNVCGANGLCGLPIGQGPCSSTNAATICQSGSCGAQSNVCIPAAAGGCGDDDDCPAESFCNGTSFLCTTKLTAGTALPDDGVHKTCPAGINSACASELCNAGSGTCANANGAACTAGSQCTQNACGRNQMCGLDDGQPGCTVATATICQTGVCAASGVCGASGCTADSDCPATAYCNGINGLCQAKLAVGQPIPSDGVHDGSCTPAAAVALCTSGACNPATDECALPTGATCTSDAVCQSGACGGNGQCGHDSGEGPCTAGDQATVCQSGLCNVASEQCQPVGQNRCTRDADCTAGLYCNRVTFTCVAKLAAGAAIPTDGLHDGVCTTASATAVCTSGLCNIQANVCATANGGACAMATSCVSNICFSDGQCALPTGLLCDASSECRSGSCTEGVCGAGPAPRSVGGGGGCSVGGTTAGTVPGGLIGFGLLALGLLAKRRRRG